jgi:divalent metal cation (Fe/Co/Zn/Cd) transporter
MVWRMKTLRLDRRDDFENTALRITGFAFYLLTAGLIAGSVLVLFTGVKPETTLAGIIISIISIFTMYFLYRIKLDVGNKLDSAPIISDAKCTKTCFYLSFILLASSTFYEILGIPFIDVFGSLGIAWYAFKEGKEAFEKARNGKLTCCEDHCK